MELEWAPAMELEREAAKVMAMAAGWAGSTVVGLGTAWAPVLELGSGTESVSESAAASAVQ